MTSLKLVRKRIALHRDGPDAFRRLAGGPPLSTTTMVKKALLGRLSDLDIRLLRVFRAVVECGGMSAARRQRCVRMCVRSQAIQ